MFVTLTFPSIGPEIFHIDAFQLFGWTLGPFALRWYALAYIVGLLLGWRYCVWLAKKPPVAVTTLQLDDFLVWAIFGVILGGRLGYVLFYQADQYIANPLTILQIWHGGMSFHGGCTRRHHRADPVRAPPQDSVPRPLRYRHCGGADRPLPRPARPTSSTASSMAARPTCPGRWCSRIPTAEPRHPSQLYEAGLEGIVLFIILFVLMQNESIRRRRGLVTGVFLAGYALARISARILPRARLLPGLLQRWARPWASGCRCRC